MRTYKKSQASIEFMFLIGFMFIIFVVFFIVIQQRTGEANEYKNRLLLKQVGRVVKSEIRDAQIFNYGYKRTFYLPKLINGKNYSINISEDGYELLLNFSNIEYLDFLDNRTYRTGIYPGENVICTKVASVHVNNCTDI
ncbi:MAG: hypothetical protein V1743_01880 [Nanoarchaeota archaeon]